MRTTLTLDDDVAAILERLRKSRGVRLQTRSVALGRLRIASLDNIGEALAVAEGAVSRFALA